MNESRCLSVQELAQALEAANDDPRKQHVLTCPRCQALAAEYQLFMSESEDLDLLDGNESARLEKALALEIEGMPPAPTMVSRSGRLTRNNPWMVRLRYTVPALAAVLALVLFLPRQKTGEPDMKVMRGGDASETRLVVQATTGDTEGGLVLTWESFADADSYEVQLLSANLTQLATVGTGNQTRLEITPGRKGLPEGCRFFRVTGFKEGSPVVRSGLRAIPQ